MGVVDLLDAPLDETAPLRTGPLPDVPSFVDVTVHHSTAFAIDAAEDLGGSHVGIDDPAHAAGPGRVGL